MKPVEGVESKRTRVSAEEMRCLQLLENHPADWVWWMTDEELATAKQAIARRAKEPK